MIDDDIRATALDPVLFGERVMRKTLWSGQQAILRALVTHRRIAVRGCHASGKTFALATVGVPWYLTRWPDGKVLTTAPTSLQVKGNIWAELREALEGCLLDFPTPNLTDLTLSNLNTAIGRSTDKGVRVRGFHAPHALVLADEANGLKPDVWTGLRGAMAGGDITVVALANPTETSGPFYDMFSKDGSSWHCLTLSAFDTPNLAGLWMPGIDGTVSGDATGRGLLELDEAELDDNPVGHLVTRRWVRDLWIDCDRDPAHPLWMSLVLAQFPTTQVSALFAETWIDRAMRVHPARTTRSVTAGVDVAGPGDDETVVAVRCGGVPLLQRPFDDHDARAAVCDVLEPYRDDLDAVGVDAIGQGWYFYQHLLDRGFPAVPVTVSESPRSDSGKRRFKDQKAERYWRFRQLVQEGVLGLPEDAELRGQMRAARWRERLGKIEIESKIEARKRGVSSPDRMEAWMLCATVGGEVYAGTADRRTGSGAVLADAPGEGDGADLPEPAGYGFAGY